MRIKFSTLRDSDRTAGDELPIGSAELRLWDGYCGIPFKVKMRCHASGWVR